MLEKTNIVSDFYGKEYSEKSAYQQFMGEKLINMIDFKNGQKVLDFGCGDGTNTFKMVNKSNISIDAFDAASKSIKIANEKKKELDFKNINFFVKNAHNFNEKNKYDIVFSNFVINWTGSKSFKIIYESLKNNGVFVGSIGLGYEGISYREEKIVLEAISNLGFKKSFENYVNQIYHPEINEVKIELEEVGFEDIIVKEVEVNQKPFYNTNDELYESILLTELNFKYLYLKTEQERKKLFNECLRICLDRKPTLVNVALIISARKL